MNPRFFVSLMLIFIMAINARANDSFILQKVKSSNSPDSAFLEISGKGNPEFETFTLDNPSRMVVRITNGNLPDIPVEMSYTDPIKRVEIQHDFAHGRCLQVVCELDEYGPLNSSRIKDGIRVSFPRVGKNPPTISVVKDPEPAWLEKKIDVNFENTPLGSALTLLAKQNGFDVVMSDLSEHEVTARLSGATVGDALKAILSVSGLTYFIAGDIVVVKTPAVEAPGEMTTRVFRLNYLDARQIEPQIKNMLSSRGKLQVVAAGQKLSDGTSSGYPSNIIAVTDIPGIIPVVAEFVSKVDIKPSQVAISVKLIETNLSDEQSFGFDWETSITSKITGAKGTLTSGDANNPLSAYSPLPIKANSFTYGTLTISEVSTLLEYLSTSGESKLLSSPSVTTTDGKPAVINVVTTIPLQTVNRLSETAVVQDIVTYTYKDIGITLDVTPIINQDGYITLKCQPTVEEITDWVGPSANRQPITAKRSVNTDVIVKSGETLVIGGLMKESVIEKTTGVWLLSDIPILGELFKHRNKQNGKTDLMILITPTIIN